MEPIGATASIVTLLALTKEIAGRGETLIRRYRGYSKALGEVRDRVIQLEVQLSLLNNVQKNVSELNLFSDDVRARLSNTLSNTHATFESIRTFLARHSEEGGTKARLKWAGKYEAEVERWIEKLAQHGHSLNIVLNILQVQLCSHSVKAIEATDGRLALIVKHQDNERQAKIIAHARDVRNKNKKAASNSDNGVLWSFLVNSPIDLRCLAFLRKYTIKFSVMYRPMKTQNIVPASAEIFKACWAGDALGVKLLLDEGKASPHDVSPDRSSPLMFAIRGGSMPIVKLLLDYGADPDAPFGKHQTPPVAEAFAKCRLDIARFLHSQGAEIDSTDAYGRTPLICFFFGSSFKNSHQIVESIELLSSASLLDVNAQNLGGWTSMHYAALYGQASDILELIRRNASLSCKTNSLQHSPIFNPVRYGKFPIFEVLADYQPDYFKEKDIQGWSLLHFAARKCRKEILARLLKDGADVHALSDARATIEIPKRLLGRAVTPLDVARASGSKNFKVFLEALKESDKEVRVIWEGCECRKRYRGLYRNDRNDVDEVCEKCDECDVFFPSVAF